jgi:hypothetical protein
MTDDSYQAETYEAPTIGVIGSVEELTQIIPKHRHHAPDNYSFGHFILTS